MQRLTICEREITRGSKSGDFKLSSDAMNQKKTKTSCGAIKQLTE